MTTAGLAPTLPASAADITASPDMQACTVDADCMMVGASCNNACSFMPVNSAHARDMQQRRTAICGTMPVAEACSTRPLLEAGCIHGRCTIATAYRQHGDKRDYGAPAGRLLKTKGPGAAGLYHEAGAAPARSPLRRDDGFTAYDMPDGGHGTVQALGTVGASAN